MSARVRVERPGPFLFLMTVMLMPLLAGAADDPRAWLERMGRAVEDLNYSGTLVHMNGGETSVLKIVHRVDNGRVTERITSDDAGREIIRNDDEVMCIFPDRRVVLVERRDDFDRAQSPLRGRLPGSAGIKSVFYHVAFAGSERIAGHDTRVIVIRPKDAYRYGYRIWVDRATAMPLKTQLVDEQGRMLEQILFSAIDLPERIPEVAVQPSISIDTFVVHQSAPAMRNESARGASDWSAAETPTGFGLTVRQARTAPEAGRGLRHLVYSDGLATVSLFIEPAVAASEQAEGLSQIGAANAYTTVHEGHMVTAVGEVPARTVEMIALSARRTGTAQAVGPLATPDQSR